MKPYCSAMVKIDRPSELSASASRVLHRCAPTRIAAASNRLKILYSPERDTPISRQSRSGVNFGSDRRFAIIQKRGS